MKHFTRAALAVAVWLWRALKTCPETSERTSEGNMRKEIVWVT